ncbi:hypothetical protein X975_13292, partial [Stegodyphus mimosarum]
MIPLPVIFAIKSSSIKVAYEDIWKDIYLLTGDDFSVIYVLSCFAEKIMFESTNNTCMG